MHPTEGHLKKRNYTTCHPSESAQRERHFAYSWMRVKEMLVPTPPKCMHAPSGASQQQILQSRSVSWSLLPPLERCTVENAMQSNTKHSLLQRCVKGGQCASSFSELHLNVAKMLHEIVVTFQYSYKRCSCLGKCNTYVKETYVHRSRCPH